MTGRTRQMVYIGRCTFEQLAVVAAALGLKTRQTREHVGDYEQLQMYAYGTNADVLLCNNVTLWAIGP